MYVFNVALLGHLFHIPLRMVYENFSMTMGSPWLNPSEAVSGLVYLPSVFSQAFLQLLLCLDQH